jgi:hypothetical protein
MHEAVLEFDKASLKEQTSFALVEDKHLKEKGLS